MNDAHLHLLVNHLPIIFPIVGIIVLLTGILSKSEPVKRAAYLVFVIGAFCSLAAMATGDKAEHFVENLPGFGHDSIEMHEEAAETFAVLSYALAIVSAVSLWMSFKQKRAANVLSMVVLVLALVMMYFAQQTGATGGEIKHDEMGSGQAAAAPAREKMHDDEH